MKVAIIGAGPAGLAAAHQLSLGGADVDVFEASDRVGGLCRSIRLWGQLVDLGPHRFFTHDPRVHEFWMQALDGDYQMVDRLTRIYYRGRFFHYPLQPANALWNMGLVEAARCMASYGKQVVFPEAATRSPATFEAWVVGRFGRRLFELFFKSYSEKLWGIPCHELDSDFASQRIKDFSLAEAAKSALQCGAKRHTTLVDRFAYPTDGAGMVYERLAETICRVGGQVRLRSPIRRILHDGQQVTGVESVDGQKWPCDEVISTMPLDLLVEGLGRPPAEVSDAVGQLRFRNTILVYLHVDAADLFPDQWLYIHCPELQTGRVTNFRNWVPTLYGKAESSILCAELWCNPKDTLWSETDDKLVDNATRELKSAGLLQNEPVSGGRVIRINRSYPVYRKGYVEHLDIVSSYLSRFRGLTPIGRSGSFKYNNQDHSVLMGLLAADNILNRQQHDIWAVNTDDEYQEAASLLEMNAGAV